MERSPSFIDAPADSSVGRFALPEGFRLQPVRLARAGALIKGQWNLETAHGGGQYEVLGTGPYFASWGRYDFRKGLSYSGTLDRPFLEVHFQLAGDMQGVENAFGVDVRLKGGQYGVIAMPPGSGQFGLSQDARGEVFEIRMMQDYVITLANRHPELLGPVIESLERGVPFVGSGRPLVITPEHADLVARLRTLELENSVATLKMEALVLDLLAVSMAGTHLPARPSVPVTSRDKDLLLAARDLLLTSSAQPPTLAELARRVGTNEYALKRGFKALFGTAPHKFLLLHRLDAARQELLDTDLPIAEISDRAGYSEPAHFTHAFRSRFGLKPSDLRKGRS